MVDHSIVVSAVVILTIKLLYLFLSPMLGRHVNIFVRCSLVKKFNSLLIIKLLEVENTVLFGSPKVLIMDKWKMPGTLDR